MITNRTIEEFPLCCGLTEVKVEIEAARRESEWSEIEGHGRVCTFGGDVTVLAARLVRVVDEDGERDPRAEELAAFDDAFWSWLSAGNNERDLQQDVFEAGCRMFGPSCED